MPLVNRKVPAGVIPVPTDVSSELQKSIALPLNPLMYVEPKTIQQFLFPVLTGKSK